MGTVLLWVAATQAESLLEILAETKPRAAEKAIRRALRDTDLSIDEWTEAIRRFTPPAPDVADGPFEITLTLPGGRDWPCLVQMPKGYDHAKPTPLVIVLPGTGAEMEMMHALWEPVAADSGFLFAFPKLLYVSTGWQFKADEREVPPATLREMKRRFNVDEDRVFLTGVSKGGHASWDVGFRFPQLFAGIVPESGRMYNHGLPLTPRFDYLENGRDLSIYQLQGAKDHAPMVEALREGCRLLEEMGADVTYVELDDRGHGASPDRYPDVLKWMSDRARTPLPKKSAVLCHDLAYGGRAWSRITKFEPGVVRENAPLILKKDYSGLIPDSELEANEVRVFESAAGLSVELTGENDVTVRARNVERFTLRISADQFDLDKPIRVSVNGSRVHDKRVAASSETLLRGFWEDVDRPRLFVAELTLKVP
ncbi:MAG: hypothetical protein A3F84_15975 [Candidatus Handelsmanbacteria bacterium RIFCSPLOWO2_12_FULL_64_10]|uniref:Peptidase S9 prolyl oligopeptidase catalytic domain-containing protein n=1 Tax=Handelsmanbacteria sp. (strain RIFCSPLOWO2_12_FULL_64_10) TaxID=1817868 RepID=A0A1F6CL73_HANXR|nr:MAG: hypothetical protein A3F84_15975 [Candidatus Handelsmanbacteria bacterium RIFCSPLOWO2_12_FULL_64_10]